MINVNMTDKAGVTLATAGKYCADNVKVTPSAEILRKDEQAKTATPTTSAQDITPDAGKALSKVTVNPITAAIVGNLDASSFAASIVAAVEGKGVTVPNGTLLDGMAALIESIEAGGGGFQVALGTFIPAETRALNLLPPVSVEHNAGFTPDVFILYHAYIGTYSMIAISAKEDILLGEGNTSYTCRVMCKGHSSMGNGPLNAYPPTGQVAYIRSSISSHKITAGQEYRWIAIGGIL